MGQKGWIPDPHLRIKFIKIFHNIVALQKEGQEMKEFDNY